MNGIFYFKCHTVNAKTETFGTGAECLSQRDARLIESRMKGVRKAVANSRCPFYRGARQL